MFSVTRAHRRYRHTVYTVRVKQIPPRSFSDIFLKRLGIFSSHFPPLLYVPIYAGLQFLCATFTKLCHIKRDHHHMLKMSTIGRNARWVVAFNIA